MLTFYFQYSRFKKKKQTNKSPQNKQTKKPQNNERNKTKKPQENQYICDSLRRVYN